MSSKTYYISNIVLGTEAESQTALTFTDAKPFPSCVCISYEQQTTQVGKTSKIIHNFQF